MVNVGDVLFRIDPRPYEAALARATAQVAQAQATLTQAEENFQRVQGLAARQVATAESARRRDGSPRPARRPPCNSRRPTFETAKLNLEYTVVTAPISGPTSLTSPPEGSLVQAQQTVLTTITQLDPAYVNFTTTDSELRELQAINRARDKPLEPRRRHGRSCSSAMARIYPQTGKVERARAPWIREPAPSRSEPSSRITTAACCPDSSCG